MMKQIFALLALFASASAFAPVSQAGMSSSSRLHSNIHMNDLNPPPSIVDITTFPLAEGPRILLGNTVCLSSSKRRKVIFSSCCQREHVLSETD